MKKTALVLITAAIAAVCWLYASAPRAPDPAPASMTPPVAMLQPLAKPKVRDNFVPDSPQHRDLLALEIERALVSRNPPQRETAFTYLLPELLQADSARVVAMLERQEPGEARDALRTAVARLWIVQDRAAAIGWMKSLDAPERRASADSAVQALAAIAPDQAIYVADEFGIGRDNGYLEHLVQIWATENLVAAERWIAAQPAGPATDQLRARIERVREQKKAAD